METRCGCIYDIDKIITIVFLLQYRCTLSTFESSL